LKICIYLQKLWKGYGHTPAACAVWPAAITAGEGTPPSISKPPAPIHNSCLPNVSEPGDCGELSGDCGELSVGLALSGDCGELLLFL
jgi:hypothetical protein